MNNTKCEWSYGEFGYLSSLRPVVRVPFRLTRSVPCRLTYSVNRLSRSVPSHSVHPISSRFTRPIEHYLARSFLCTRCRCVLHVPFRSCLRNTERIKTRTWRGSSWRDFLRTWWCMSRYARRVINFKFPLKPHQKYCITVWRTWLYLAYSDERWLYYQFSLPHLDLRIGSIIIFNLSKLWKTKFFKLCDLVFMWGCRGKLKFITLGSERTKQVTRLHINIYLGV